MDEDLYDEFGNHIGDGTQLSDSDDSISVSEGQEVVHGDLEHDSDPTDLVQRDVHQQFDEDVDVLVEIEDREPEKPLITSDSRNNIEGSVNRRVPKALFDREYLCRLFKVPGRQLNVGIYGSLHSGKTSLGDMFALDTLHRPPGLTKRSREGWEQLRYLDQTQMEKERGVSLRLNGMTVSYESSRGRTYAVTLLDTPGHVNFWDDVGITLESCQNGIIVIDIVEGVTSIVAKLIRELTNRNIPFVIILNKIDRLILDLKLPPVDAYRKLQYTVDQINSYTKQRFSPELGNVLFASTQFRLIFSIESFVNSFYSRTLKNNSEEFIKRLWGQINYRKGSFHQTEFITDQLAFIQFILNPLYKIFTYTLSLSEKDLKEFIQHNFDILLSDEILQKDPKPLLCSVLHSMFPKLNCIIDSIVEQQKNHPTSSLNETPKELTTVRVLRHLSFDSTRWSLCRVESGVVQKGDKLYLLNETVDSIDEDDDEYPLICIKKIALMGGRYVYEIPEAVEGQIVLLQGVEEHFTKYATLFSSIRNPLPPINYINESVFKLALQPQRPSDLPRLLVGLQDANCFYPALKVRVEESGENIIIGTGELYLDCVMEELRKSFSGIEVKVSQPLVQFTESCSSESFASIPVTSSNETVSISVMAEKLDDKIVHDITHGTIDASELSNMRRFSKRLRTEYGWDSLAARNCWALSHCNVFIDDTLPDETDKHLLKRFKANILQGFEWAVKEGPLADETIHACQFKLLDFHMKEDKLDEFIPSQLVPMTRKACYIAMMSALPIIMEPIYEVDIIVAGVLESVVQKIIHRRRGGRIYRTEKIVASPFIEIKAQLPVIESIGFETDLRIATSGAGMCQMHFWNKIWRRVPGDVLDEDAYIPKLKPAPTESLSRDFVMKTRRRKGLSESGHVTNDGPSLKNYIDNELFSKLKQQGFV